MTVENIMCGDCEHLTQFTRPRFACRLLGRTVKSSQKACIHFIGREIGGQEYILLDKKGGEHHVRRENI